ncbi:hypothetical protein HID58_037236 [Brassica napus]|uniref:Uncharacterized protein n=1 Tax=Brassica napus TaxID=3708 RepID=A0ABQ8BKR7_BRANA|nr:hypothetical protein HID58_037236 [Brassica napus]
MIKAVSPDENEITHRDSNASREQTDAEKQRESNIVLRTKKWRRDLWKASVYLITLGMLISLLMGLNMSWIQQTCYPCGSMRSNRTICENRPSQRKPKEPRFWHLVAASAAAWEEEKAWVSMVARNLTLLGSEANLIVCEQARRAVSHPWLHFHIH